MYFEPVSKESVSDKVLDQIKRRIDAREVKPGDRLPPRNGDGPQSQRKTECGSWGPIPWIAMAPELLICRVRSKQPRSGLEIDTKESKDGQTKEESVPV
jgi:hypothetical protein